MGLIVLIVFAVYVLLSIGLMIAAHFFGKRKNLKWCNWWVIGLVMVLIPTWDILPGRLYFSYLCNTEAGMFIYQTVELPEEYFLKAGDRNARYQSNSKKYYAEGGELNLEQIKENYSIDTEFDKEFSNWGHLFKRETTISEMEDVLGRATSFYYRGGWVTAPLHDNRAGSHACPEGAVPKDSQPSIHSNLADAIFIKNI